MPALALACATYLVLSLYETLHPGRLGGLGAVFDRLGVFPPFLLVVVAVGIVGFRGDLPPADGRAWRTLAGALALDLLAQVLWLSLPPGYQPVVVVAESLAYAGMFRALLALPSPLRHSRERLPFWLDVMTVALSASMWAWYFVIAPVTLGGQAINVLHALSAVARPVADIVLLFVALVVLLQGHSRGLRRALRFLTVACLLQVGASLSRSYFTLQYIYESAALYFRFFAYASYVFVALAACAQVGPRAHEEVPPPSRRWGQVYRRLPYLALLIGFGLLLHASREQWLSGLGGLIWASGLLTAFAVARQVWSLREGARVKIAAEARFRSLVQHSADVIAILDPQERLSFVSPAVTELLGLGESEVRGQPLAALVHPDDVGRVRRLCAQARTWNDGAPVSAFRVRHHSGEWRHVEAVATDLAREPNVNGIVLNLRDITERVLLEEQLAHQALHDSLTGLANRVLFKNRLEHELALAPRRTRGIGVLFLDLDDFKVVNDTLGHAHGDQLLVTIARRLLAVTREGDTVARLGGDEFAILLTDVGPDGAGTGSDDPVIAVTERLMASLQAPVPLEGKEVRVGTSIGIVRSRPGDRADDLLKNADLAMYQAKRQGKGHYVFYAEQMQAEVLARLQLEEDLRAAVDHPAEHFQLHFQPIVDLESGTMCSVEVLTRWHHRERGVVPPARFIPLAEETGLILPLGRWILEEACREASSWESRSDVIEGLLATGAEEAQAGDPLFVSDPSRLVVTVNVSGRQIQEPGFAAEVLQILERTGLAPERLLLEITEGVLMHDSEEVLTTLHTLRARGVRWAIDDFGTGYSSLGYLRRFPVDVLKIDRSFVNNLEDGPAAALTNTVIMLGQVLSLTTVAEGIETAEQLQRLRDLGCSMGQGYHLARPMPREHLAELLQEPQAAPAR